MTDREHLEERRRALRQERASTASYYELVKLMPGTEGELRRRLEGEMAALEAQLGEVEDALRRLPPPAPTLN